MSADSGPGRREVARRLFAVEFDAADYEYAESDEERAPKYVVTPTGARVNRLFAVGVLTEIEPVNEDVLRARVVDQTGAFVVYAGQYQPDAKTFLERAEIPAFVAATGKANTFQPDGSDRVFTSVRPESLSEVEASTRDRWTVGAAEHTIKRIAVMARALESDKRGADLRRSLEAAGVEADLAAGVPLAIDHYGTTPGYLAALRETALQALEAVAGDRDEVEAVEQAPDDATGDVELASLAAPELVELDELPDVPAPGADEPSEPAAETVPDPDEPAAETAHDGDDGDEEPVEIDAEPAATDEPADEDVADADEDAADADEDETPPAEDVTPTDASTGADEPAESEGAAGADNGASDEPLEDFDAGEEFELDEEEREHIEETYGTEFTSGAEVDSPGEADIETPAPEPGDDEAEEEAGEANEPTDDATATEDESAVDEAEQTEAAESTTDDKADAGDLDVEAAVLEVMRDLAGDDGADREAITASVIEAHGIDPDEVEDAIQEALMDGECYEPTEGKLKPI